jgi:hypothetical protein
MTGKRGDAAVYSFWKLVPAMTGGGLRLNNEALRRPLDYRRIPVRASAVLMKRLLEQAINNLEDGVIKTAFNYLDRQRMGLKAAPFEPAPPENPPDDVFPFDPRLADAGIPLLSRVILHSSDLAAMVATRRRNYQAWMDGLRFGTALRPVFRSLPPSVCPWALPVILEGRREIDLRIRSQGVPLFTFGDVLHGALYRSPPTPGLERAQFLADNLMCLPVHQNLVPAQIEGYCRIVNAYLQSQRISLPARQHADHLPPLQDEDLLRGRAEVRFSDRVNPG